MKPIQFKSPGNSFFLFSLALLLLPGALFSQKGTTKPITPWYPELNDKGESVFGVFESRVPCADCERIKVALVLYKDQQTGRPASYLMARVYVGKNNDRLVNKGKVKISQGTHLDPAATVYELDANAPEGFNLFWMLGDDLLFMLDHNRKPRVGDAGAGYVLNKTK